MLRPSRQIVCNNRELWLITSRRKSANMIKFLLKYEHEEGFDAGTRENGTSLKDERLLRIGGRTKIGLVKRWFGENWKKMMRKPFCSMVASGVRRMRSMSGILLLASHRIPFSWMRFLFTSTPNDDVIDRLKGMSRSCSQLKSQFSKNFRHVSAQSRVKHESKFFFLALAVLPLSVSEPSQKCSAKCLKEN